MSAEELGQMAEEGGAQEGAPEAEPVAAFCERYGVTLEPSLLYVGPDKDVDLSRPVRPGEYRDLHRSHWRCVLTLDGKQLATEYHMGSGHRVWSQTGAREYNRRYSGGERPRAKIGERAPSPLGFGRHRHTFAEYLSWTAPTVPTVDEVMDALRGDAACVEGFPDFEEWAPELGYDPDSRAAEAVYRELLRARERVKNWLGWERFEELLACEWL